MGGSYEAEAPDYSAANREAVYADFETLPERRKIEAAAKLGQKVTYTDPRTGQLVTADFTGVGDDTYAKAAAQIALDMNRQMNIDTADFRSELVTDPLTGKQVTRGEYNALQSAREIEASDPEGYAARKELTQQVMNDLQREDPEIAANTKLGELADQVGNLKGPEADKRYDELYMRGESNLKADDSSTAALNAGLAQVLKDFELGGKLDDASRREVEQSARAGMAARGNMLGNSAAFSEAMEVGSAAEQRKAERLASLLDVQGRSFSQNQTLQAGERENLGVLSGLVNADVMQKQQGYQNQLAQIAQQAGLTQSQITEDRATRTENYGRQQQKLANASSFILGQPVTNQFGSLAAAQQGAVGFQNVGYQSGAGVADPSQAAGQIYGMQGQMYQQAQQLNAQNQSQWMQLAGSAAGAAAGMMM